MKLKSRIMKRYSWGKPDRIATKHRRPPMPQFPSTLAAEHAADSAHTRCNVFHIMKRINKLARRRMSDAVMQQLCGGGNDNMLIDAD